MGKLFKGHTTRKFNYIPRYYDKENNDLIYNRIGDGAFAQRYVKKKKMMLNETMENEGRIDLTSYRVRQKRSNAKPKFNTILILVALMLLIMVMWLITNPDFTNIFTQ